MTFMKDIGGACTSGEKLGLSRFALAWEKALHLARRSRVTSRNILQMESLLASKLHARLWRSIPCSSDKTIS